MTYGQSTTIIATVTDNAAVASASVRIRDPAGADLGNFTMTPSGGSSFTRSFTPTGLGTYAFTVWATDITGLSASRAGQFASVDATSPVVAFAGATPATQELGQATLLLATASDDVGVSTVAVAVRDPAGQTVGNFTMSYSPINARYEHSRTFPAIGMYTFAVWAMDAAGNVGSRSGTFEVRDTSGPAISAAAASPPFVELGQSTTLTADVTDLGGVASVSVLVRDPSGLTVGTFPMVNAGGDSYAYTFLPSSLGAYTFVVLATDPSGNTASSTGAFATTDSTPPVITASSATPNPAELGGAVTISVQATDLAGVTEARALVRDSAGVLLASLAMTDLGGGSFSTSYRAGVLGAITYEVGVTDRGGNTATASSTVSVRDTTPPAADAGPDQTVPQGATVTLDAATGSTDNDRIASYVWTFTAGGNPVTLAGSTVVHRFDAPGTVVVTLTATDPSGNPATDTVTITVTSVTTSIEGLVTDEAGAPISGASVTAYSGTAVVASATTDAGGLFAIPGVAPGGYIVRTIAAGFLPGALAVTTEVGQVTTLVVRLAPDVPAPTEGSLQGLLSDRGRPAAGATVRLLRAGQSAGTATTDAAGLFAFSGLAPGTYVIVAESSDGRAASAFVTVDAGEVATATLELPPADGSPGVDLGAAAAGIALAAIVAAVVGFVAGRRKGGGPAKARKPEGGDEDER